jgi:hypothetical protein
MDATGRYHCDVCFMNRMIDQLNQSLLYRGSKRASLVPLNGIDGEDGTNDAAREPDRCRDQRCRAISRVIGLNEDGESSLRGNDTRPPQTSPLREGHIALRRIAITDGAEPSTRSAMAGVSLRCSAIE